MSLLKLALETGDKPEEYVAFDLDGTLAVYDGWKGIEHIGEPIPKAIALVKAYLKRGDQVRIMTARVASDEPERAAEAASYVQAWCREHIGYELPVTCKKDPMMRLLYDDRARQVIQNEGVVVLP